jgi:hypothetical protein
MLAEVELEVLRFFERTTLEAWQLVSRSARNRVDEHAAALPLRRLELVDVVSLPKSDIYRALQVTEY